MDWFALGRDYGWAVVLVGLIVYALWHERNRILTLLGKKVALAERERVDELDFDEAVRKRLLNGDNYSRNLVDRLFSMYEDERIERKAMVATLMQQAKATETLVNEALDTMLRFVDISRMQSERITKAIDQHTEAMIEHNKINAATWFVLTKYSVRNSDIQEALDELEE